MSDKYIVYSAIQKVSMMQSKWCRRHAGQVWPLCIWIRSLASFFSPVWLDNLSSYM